MILNQSHISPSGRPTSQGGCEGEVGRKTAKAVVLSSLEEEEISGGKQMRLCARQEKLPQITGFGCKVTVTQTNGRRMPLDVLHQAAEKSWTNPGFGRGTGKVIVFVMDSSVEERR